MTATPSRRSYSQRHLPAPRVFERIPVLPATRYAAKLLDGGPDWPDWDDQIEIRHIRNGKAVDTRPALPEAGAGLEPLAGSFIWGGQLIPHFGHFIGEQTDRILPSLTHRPDDDILFTALKIHGKLHVPRYLFDILAWLGVADGRVRIVETPLSVERLLVSPQVEPLPNSPSCTEYLELLERNEVAQNLQPVASDVLFVSRAGMVQEGAGISAGEAYVERLAAAAGATVIRPETLTLREQLAHYSGARTIIFSEGSAQHGRQLLGRKDQHILVLRRRPSALTAQASLLARTDWVTYCDTALGVVATESHSGMKYAANALSLYDIEALLDSLAFAGLDVRRHFDRGAYEAQRDEDFRVWLTAGLEPAHRVSKEASLESIRSGLDPFGLAHLVDTYR